MLDTPLIVNCESVHRSRKPFYALRLIEPLCNCSYKHSSLQSNSVKIAVWLNSSFSTQSINFKGQSELFIATFPSNLHSMFYFKRQQYCLSPMLYLEVCTRTFYLLFLFHSSKTSLISKSCNLHILY